MGGLEMRELKILIACGSGIATSTVVQEKVKELLEGENIPAKLIKGTVGQVEKLQEDVDLILITTRYNKELDKPVIPAFGLISGINEDKLKEEIVSTCKEILGG